MTKNVLFVCVENAGRSQMAEAFFRKFTEGKFNVNSAGTVPSGTVSYTHLTLPTKRIV